MKQRGLEPQILVLVTLGLAAFGLVMIYSATSAAAALGGDDPSEFLKRQGTYALLGLGLLILASRFDFRKLRALAPTLLVAAFALCVAVLLVAEPVNGARRWLGVGPFTFQPSELAKLAFAIWGAAYLSRRKPPQTLSELVKPFGLVLVLLGAVILVEPDLGTTISLFITASALLLVSGVPGRVLGSAAGITMALGAVAIWFEPYRRERLLSFLNPWEDAQGAGFQIVQAQIGLGSGGLFGEGLGQGVQKIHYLPEAHTDMIFAIVGEELGLIGATLVIGAFALLAVTGFRIARRCQDPFGKLLAAGITALVCGQAAINLAASLGIAPLTGIPLPFVSYGGSSLIVLLAAVGILLNIAVNGRVVGASLRDRGGRDRRTRAAGSRSRRSASRARGDGDVRRVARPRRVAARS